MDTSLYCNSIDRSAFISYTIKIASVCLCFVHAYFIENIVLFIPFGLIFPLVFKNWMRWFTIPVGAFISAAIEYTQLVTGRGYCQLDDFVTNTAGAAIGFFIYLILYAGWLVWKKIR